MFARLPAPLIRPSALRTTMLARARILASLTAALLLSGSPALAQAREARQACGSDVQRLCAGTAPGGGRILQCLKARTADLSPTCRSFLERVR